MSKNALAKAMAFSVAMHLALLLGIRYTPPRIPPEKIVRVSLIELKPPLTEQKTPPPPEERPPSPKEPPKPKETPKIVQKKEPPKIQQETPKPQRIAELPVKDLQREMERHYQEALERIKGRVNKPQVETPPPAEVFDLYLGLITAKVRSAWAVPEGFVDWSAKAVIRLKIDGQGRVLSAKVEEPSGNPVFDRSVLQAIYKAEPFPPPPGGKEMEVGFVFRP